MFYFQACPKCQTGTIYRSDLQAELKCLNCGLSIDSDVVAARVLSMIESQRHTYRPMTERLKRYPGAERPVRLCSECGRRESDPVHAVTPQHRGTPADRRETR